MDPNYSNSSPESMPPPNPIQPISSPPSQSSFNKPSYSKKNMALGVLVILALAGLIFYVLVKRSGNSLTLPGLEPKEETLVGTVTKIDKNIFDLSVSTPKTPPKFYTIKITDSTIIDQVNSAPNVINKEETKKLSDLAINQVVLVAYIPVKDTSTIEAKEINIFNFGSVPTRKGPPPPPKK